MNRSFSKWVLVKITFWDWIVEKRKREGKGHDNKERARERRKIISTGEKCR